MHTRQWSGGLCVSALIAICILGASACGLGAAPSPVVPSAPAQPAEQQPAAVPPSGGAPTAPDWQGQWDKLVAAARQEGQLLLSAPPSDSWREVLTSFQSDFPGITVEYTGLNSRDFFPRLLQERQAGQYLWDLRVGGPDADSYAARDAGVLEPIRPLLILPEVLDDSKWIGGLDSLFSMDKEGQYFPAFLWATGRIAYVNRDAIPLGELQSTRELIDPKWKGKIVLQDPRGGSGLANLTVMLKGYGEDFVRDLLTKQDVVVTNDNRQQAEWVIRARSRSASATAPSSADASTSKASV